MNKPTPIPTRSNAPKAGDGKSDTSGEGASTAMAAMLKKRQMRVRDTTEPESQPSPNGAGTPAQPSEA